MIGRRHHSPRVGSIYQSKSPGRAIDLGCGTGTNVIGLAKAGWKATGVDFVPKAIRLAKLKTKDKNISAEFIVGDVRRYKIFSGHYDLILDIGCYHDLTFDQQEKYRENIKSHLALGGQFLLYSFLSEKLDRRAGLSSRVLGFLESEFTLMKREEGINKEDPSSAWFWFSK